MQKCLTFNPSMQNSDIYFTQPKIYNTQCGGLNEEYPSESHTFTLSLQLVLFGKVMGPLGGLAYINIPLQLDSKGF